MRKVVVFEPLVHVVRRYGGMPDTGATTCFPASCRSCSSGPYQSNLLFCASFQSPMSLMQHSQFLPGVSPVMYHQQQLAQAVQNQLVGQMLAQPPGMAAMFDRNHSSGSYNIHAAQPTVKSRSDVYDYSKAQTSYRGSPFNQSSYDHFPRPYEHMQRPAAKNATYNHRIDSVSSNHLGVPEPVRSDKQAHRYRSQGPVHQKVDKIGGSPSSVFESYDKVSNTNHSAYAKVSKKNDRHITAECKLPSTTDGKCSFRVENIAKPAQTPSAHFSATSSRVVSDSTCKHLSGSRSAPKLNDSSALSIGIDPSHIVSPLSTDFYRPQPTHVTSGVNGPNDMALKPVKMPTTLPVFYSTGDSPYSAIYQPAHMYTSNNHESPHKKQSEQLTTLQRPAHDPKTPLPHSRSPIADSPKHAAPVQYMKEEKYSQESTSRPSVWKATEYSRRPNKSQDPRNVILQPGEKPAPNSSPSPVLHNSTQRPDSSGFSQAQPSHALPQATADQITTETPGAKRGVENSHFNDIDARSVVSPLTCNTDEQQQSVRTAGDAALHEEPALDLSSERPSDAEAVVSSVCEASCPQQRPVDLPTDPDEQAAEAKQWPEPQADDAKPHPDSDQSRHADDTTEQLTMSVREEACTEKNKDKPETSWKGKKQRAGRKRGRRSGIFSYCRIFFSEVHRRVALELDEH